jgi:hypothetical protein
MQLRQIISLFPFFIWMLLLPACDKVEGLDPAKNTVPESTAKLVIENFPNAKNVVLKTIKENELWEARFVEDDIQYYIGLNTREIVATHKLLSPTLPDSIQRIIRNYIPIAKNAELSDYQEDLMMNKPMPNTNYYRAIMVVDRSEYVIKWFSNGSILNINMEDYCVFEFLTDVRYEALPEVLTEFTKRTGYFVIGLKTRVLSENKLAFYFIPENRADYMILSEKGKLTGSYEGVEVYRSYGDLPKVIQEKLIYYGIQNYQLSVFCFKFFEDNSTGYRILVYGGKGGGYYLFFDEDGNVTSLVNVLNLSLSTL